MTASITEQICGQAVAVVSAATGLPTYRDRAEAVGRAEAPCVLVEPDTAVGDDQHSNCRTAWTLLLRIIIIVRGGSVSTLADPYRVLIHRALMADPTLDGLATNLGPPEGNTPAVDWQNDGGDAEPGLCILTYQVAHRSLTTDLAIP